MLQFVCYPTYLLVGEQEFIAFHVSFGRRLLIVVVPMILTCLGMFALVFLRPSSAPEAAALIAATCGGVILGATIISEVPKHQKLDKVGKDVPLIKALIQDNMPRTIAWTMASFALAYMAMMSMG